MQDIQHLEMKREKREMASAGGGGQGSEREGRKTSKVYFNRQRIIVRQCAGNETRFSRLSSGQVVAKNLKALL